jgi:hypothetical protein
MPVRFCPSSPLPPFSHKGRRGSLGVLKPKTSEGTQGLPKKTYLCKISPTPFSHKGSLGVLKPKTRAGTQGLPKNLPLEDPPNFLLPQGEKGGSGRPEARNRFGQVRMASAESACRTHLSDTSPIPNSAKRPARQSVSHTHSRIESVRHGKTIRCG